MKRARKLKTPRWKDGSARTHLLSICVRFHIRIFTMSLKTIGSGSQRGFWCIQEVIEECIHANVCMFHDVGGNGARGGSSNVLHCAGRVREHASGAYCTTLRSRLTTPKRHRKDAL